MVLVDLTKIPAQYFQDFQHTPGATRSLRPYRETVLVLGILGRSVLFPAGGNGGIFFSFSIKNVYFYYLFVIHSLEFELQNIAWAGITTETRLFTRAEISLHLAFKWDLDAAFLGPLEVGVFVTSFYVRVKSWKNTFCFLCWSPVLWHIHAELLSFSPLLDRLCTKWKRQTDAWKILQLFALKNNLHVHLLLSQRLYCSTNAQCTVLWKHLAYLRSTAGL